jgi:hypothetical protein
MCSRECRMEINRDLAEVTLQWSLMDWVSGTQFYHRASHVSSVVCVAQWIQEGENHTPEFAGYVGTLERLDYLDQLVLARGVLVLALTDTDGARDHSTSTRVSQISSNPVPCNDTIVGLVSSIALRRNGLR